MRTTFRIDPLRPALLGVLLALLAACTTLPRPALGTFVDRTVSVDGAAHRYRVFVPAGPADAAPGSDRARPVVLFLHGSGERGADGAAPASVGLGPYLRAHAATFPALVVFPQVPADQEWAQNAAVAMAALDAATAEFGGDAARTYLTGISMGGYGTWELALRHPGRFAALVPVCGGITAPPGRPQLRVAAADTASDPFAETARRLRTVPTWIFHGGRDDVVPPEQSRRMAAALAAAGAGDSHYSEFAGVGHASWDAAYAHAPMWDWLLAHRLGDD
ncbi:MAG TPA: prolyl oligopeptidase family serine peptidase [Luteimonas sp.]|nr:prolyl oligopeptidase family serine peptidase [Luteimonas sp.]